MTYEKITENNVNKYIDILYSNKFIKNESFEYLLDTNQYLINNIGDILKYILEKNNIYIVEISENFTRIEHRLFGLSGYCNKSYLNKEELNYIKDDLRNIRHELKNLQEDSFKYLDFTTMKELESCIQRYFNDKASYYPSENDIKDTLLYIPEFLNILINTETKELFIGE